MIEQVMLFSLGFLVAALGALAVAPAFWNRAIRLSTRRLEMVLPLSAGEIRAERDLLRASLAVEQRKLEQKVEALGAVRARNMAELVRRAVAVAEKDTEIELLRECLAARDTEIADLRRFSAEATAALDATTTALHDANARWDRSQADLQNVRQEFQATQKLCADQAEALAELELKLVHEHDSQIVEAVAGERLADDLPDLRREHDVALARLKSATAEISDAAQRSPMVEAHGADRRAERSEPRRDSIASDESLRHEIDRLYADLVSYQDAVDAGSTSRERGRASADERARLRKRISEVGAKAARLADAGKTAPPERRPIAATEPEV